MESNHTMTDQTVETTATTNSDAASLQIREAAHKQMRKAFGQLVAAYGGSETDALHDWTYSFDVDTRIRALYRKMSDGADLGQVSRVELHLGGYEYTLTRDTVGDPTTRIEAPKIGVYDINGVKFAEDGYAVKRGKNSSDDTTVGSRTAKSMTEAVAAVASNVGRMGLRIAEAALVPHVAESSDDRAEKKTRAASGTSKELSELRSELAENRAMMSEMFALLKAQSN